MADAQFGELFKADAIVLDRFGGSLEIQVDHKRPTCLLLSNAVLKLMICLTMAGNKLFSIQKSSIQLRGGGACPRAEREIEETGFRLPPE